MKSLPLDVTAYKKTPEFDESSVPNGLLNNHKTKEGVWGKIVVLEGNLLYTINEPKEEIYLDTNNVGVVEPTVLHQVKPLGKVRFYVEFYHSKVGT
ncbi:MAG: DUF1971 domain-containing protein [Pseudomonadota bacterium]